MPCDCSGSYRLTFPSRPRSKLFTLLHYHLRLSDFNLAADQTPSNGAHNNPRDTRTDDFRLRLGYESGRERGERMDGRTRSMRCMKLKGQKSGRRSA